MCVGKPKIPEPPPLPPLPPPPPTPSDPDTAQTINRTRRQQRQLAATGGRSSTILTGGLGLSDSSDGPRTLLGG